MQYTLRGIPDEVDRALRRRARSEGVSLNRAAIAALARGLGLDGPERRVRDLGALAGRWVDDPACDRALADMDRVDEDLWG